MKTSTFLLLVGVIYLAPHISKRFAVIVSSVFIGIAAAMDMGWL